VMGNKTMSEIAYHLPLLTAVDRTRTPTTNNQQPTNQPSSFYLYNKRGCYSTEIDSAERESGRDRLHIQTCRIELLELLHCIGQNLAIREACMRFDQTLLAAVLFDLAVDGSWLLSFGRDHDQNGGNIFLNG
jgi:hypothetical protein